MDTKINNFYCMKKFIIAITAVMLCVAETLARDVEIDGIYYYLYESDKVAVVTYKGDASSEYDKYSGSVTIPETITYNSQTYSVTSIGYQAFRGCSGLTSVTIPNSVTSIGSSAFSGCSGLTSVTIPNSVTSIGDYAFRGCSGLTSVTIGNSVTSIGDWTFYNCSGLTSVTIPTSVTSIGDLAFYNCSGLTSVTIPTSVTSIGDLAFYNCSGLTSVTIPTSVTSIGEEAFFDCSGLTKVNYLGTVDKWVEIDFEDSYSNPTGYAKDLYINNELLTDVKITTADSIKGYAFYNCQSIKSVEIGNNVTSIGSYAFFGCSGLTKVNYLGTVDKWVEIDFEGAGSNPTIYAKDLYINNELLTDVKITTADSIKDYAFSNCQSIKSVEIGESVISIGSSAFSGCSGLTSVTIPNSVTSIGSWSFADCSGLTSVTIPNSVTSIGGSAFDGCRGLTSVTIPNSVTSIGQYAFRGCSGLTKVNYLGTVDKWVEIDFDDYDSNPTYYAKDLYINNELLTDVKITTADSIKDYAFSKCQSIKSVEIGNNVTSIGEEAFYNTGIYNNNSNWDNGVLYIDNCLIKAKSDVVKGSYTIKEGTRVISGSAFYYCSNLSSITIPNSVTSIGYYAFEGCSGLTKVNYLGTVDKWVEIDFNSSYSNPTGYAKDLYINNELLTDVKITTADSIKGYAFYNCQSIKSVEIGNNVTSIGSYAFSYCSGLTSVTIGESVTSIGKDAFYYCRGLTSVIWNVKNCEDFSSNSIAPFYNIRSNITSFAFGNEVEHIPAYLCYGMSGLKIISVPTNVKSIGDESFYKCYNLKKVRNFSGLDIVKGETTHGCVAYYADVVGNKIEGDFVYDNNDVITEYIGDSNVTSITIPLKAKGIYKTVFTECTKLISVVWNAKNCEDFEDYDETPFYNIRSQITSFTFGNEVEHIPAYLCYGMSKLVEITIPTSVTSIGDWAFRGCSGLTSVTIPNSVTSIGDDAFRGCSGLTEILVLSNNEEFSSENGVLYNKDKTTLIKYPEGKKDTSFTIPNSVTSIGEDAFSGCSGLTSVTIPTSVTSIGYNAFSGCSGLTKVNYLASVDKWVEIDFEGYASNPTYNANDLYINNELITDVKITSADNINRYAFYGCQSIKSVEIGESVTSIGDYAFRGCSGLTKVNYLASVDKWVEIDFEGYASNPTYNANDLYINNELITDVKITSADNINRYAFYGCQSIKSVEIGKSVTSIGSNAFSGCNNLKTVYNCSSLDIVKGSYTNGYVAYYADEVINGYPVGDFIVNYADEIIEYIGDTTVNKIEIPEFVTGIEPDVFASCANIDTIVWNAIDCADFTETTAPFNAQAAQIKSVIFGNNVEYIPAYLCSDMTLLTEISIPGEVNSIGENAFVGCSRLRYITSYPTLVPLAKESSFNSYNAYLYIPCDYYDYYYLDDVFGKFKEIKCISAEEVEGSEKVEIEVDSNNNATIIWPSTGNASSYEIIISKNGEVFCTLLFNENGQLISIDFGNRSASVGFQFTVTGLDGASKYSYSIVAKDEEGNELESYNGTFTTNGYSEETAILETLADTNITITSGTISADTDFTIYNTIGQNVTAKNGSLTPGVYIVNIGDDIAKVMVK